MAKGEAFTYGVRNIWPCSDCSCFSALFKNTKSLRARRGLKFKLFVTLALCLSHQNWSHKKALTKFFFKLNHPKVWRSSIVNDVWIVTTLANFWMPDWHGVLEWLENKHFELSNISLCSHDNQRPRSLKVRRHSWLEKLETPCVWTQPYTIKQDHKHKPAS